MYVKEKMPIFFLDIKTNAVLEGSTAQFMLAPRGVVCVWRVPRIWRGKGGERGKNCEDV